MVGILAIAALGFLVAHLWHHTHGVVASPGTTALSAPPRTTTGARAPAASTAATTPTRATTVTHTQKTTATRAMTTTTRAVGHVSLLLTARADTWLEVRSGSSTGSVLYSGTLAAGSTKSFRARSVWARFGAAGSLSARLDRKELRLPSGTYDATFDARGFRRLGG